MPRRFSMICASVFWVGFAFAQDVESYKVPPPELAALADAPLTPSAFISPGDQWMLLLDVPALLAIEDVAQPELKLAGVRFNPKRSDQTRSGSFTGITVVELRSGRQRPVSGLPAAPRIRNLAWSKDGERFAFTLTTKDGVELWSGETAAATVRRLTDSINAAYPARPFRWLSDGRTLVARLGPETRAQAPAEQGVPAGPIIQENLGRKTPARTYPDMIRNPYEAALFEHHMQSQLALVDATGGVKRIGAAGLIADADPSPNGEYLLVEIMQRPFSYVLPESRFPRRYEIWNREGARVREVAAIPLADAVPTDFSATRTGPRSLSWRSDKPATLFWAEAQDEGNPRVEAAIRDRLYVLDAPFDGKSREIAALATRFSGIWWGSSETAIVNEAWWKTRNTKSWRIAPDDPAKKPQLLFDRSFEDRYSDPGSPIVRSNSWGKAVLRIAPGGRAIFLSGEGASPEGDRPFLDRLDLASGKSTRLWRSEAPHYENVHDLLDDAGTRLVTRRESVGEAPNYYLRELKSKKLRALTQFPHPTPALSKAQKELIHYQRADGVKLTGTLYLPPGYDPKKDGPLPVLMWAYPTEFKSADAASQVAGSPHRFIRLSPMSPLPWLARGYAILDDPKMPIVGEGKIEPNDTYVDQLVAGAKAAIDELVRRGVGDAKRMAIGGHSYGAFTTANLLAHSDLFRAGIARSGAYNRTLTPFGFQAEERTFWEAPETYMNMSPFTHAQKINEPLLMIHGADDNNSGTFPIQSERFYQAIKGLGGTVRFVMLPSESHGYRARESVLHQMWEIDQWLEKYVKGSG